MYTQNGQSTGDKGGAKEPSEKENGGMYNEKDENRFDDVLPDGAAVLRRTDNEYADGKRKVISSSEKWKINADGAIRSNNEYDGEIYDATKMFADWTKPGFDDTQWEKAERVAIPLGTLRGAMSPNMKVVNTLQPKTITQHPTSNTQHPNTTTTS